MMPKVYYVHHSCFIVEYSSCFMMFDYFKHLPSKKEHDFDFYDLINTILNSDKSFYIFSSHSHGDHFNKKIFDYNSPKTEYILSEDIIVEKNLPNIHYIGPDKTLNLNDITINTFNSTDLGVSFMINAENLLIFHAGDLNWWAWSDDTKAEAEYMENFYKNTVEQIKAHNKTIDISFFPIDKRLEDNYAMGGKYFIEQLSPKVFIPMHFGDAFDITEEFYEENQKNYQNTEIIKILNNNSIIM